MERNRIHQYTDGVKADLPIIMGFISIGMAFAVMAGEAGLNTWQTVIMSILVFAGASQIMSVGMIAQGASLGAIVIATFIINLRHIIMSTCVMGRMKGVSRSKKLIAAFGVTDESFAIFTTIVEKKCTVWYFFGVVTVTYSSWVLGTLLGAIASNFLPEIVSNSLNIAQYALFTGLLVPSLKKDIKLTILVLITCAVNALLNMFMTSSWALIISTLLCAGIGVFITDDERKEDGHGKAYTDSVDGGGDLHTENAASGDNRQA